MAAWAAGLDKGHGVARGDPPRAIRIQFTLPSSSTAGIFACHLIRRGIRLGAIAALHARSFYTSAVSSWLVGSQGTRYRRFKLLGSVATFSVRQFGTRPHGASRAPCQRSTLPLYSQQARAYRPTLSAPGSLTADSGSRLPVLPLRRTPVAAPRMRGPCRAGAPARTQIALPCW